MEVIASHEADGADPDLFWMEVIASHEADGAFKTQDSDIAPRDIAVFAIEVAHSYFRVCLLGKINLLNCTGPAF
ncbi:MAG: hypothetical protein B7X60_16280 [Polynucleobacter sp. 39-45-136]|nr:MAG: hypothetical protein B7X60_16280 [Polynucleobacter sp. 39-45-136]